MKPAQVDTPSETGIEVTRSFDASTELVWKAYTDAGLISRWMLGPPGWTMSVVEMDVRPNGKYHWRWRNQEDGSEFGFAGEFREVVPQSRLIHTQIYDSGDLPDSMGDRESVVTVAFTEANGVTTTATKIEFASKEDRDAAISTGMTDGMEMSYQRLEKLLAE